LNTHESVFAADIYCHSTFLFNAICSFVKTVRNKIRSSSKRNQTFSESYVSYPLNKYGYGLTVTEIKDFIFNLAENYDIELYNKDVHKSLLDNYGEKTEFCPSYRVVENRDSQRDF